MSLIKTTKQREASFCTSADSAGKDPGSGGDGSFDEALPENLLEFGLQIKVLQASVDRDEQRGKFQLPIFNHELEQVVRFGIVGHPDVLQRAGGGHGLVTLAQLTFF